MPITTSEYHLTGCMSKERYLAAIFDEFLALVPAFITAVKVSPYGNVASWSAGGVVFFGYFLLSELIFRNTIGKWICGLRIRTLMGHPANRSQLAIRSVFRILEVNPFVLGFLPAAIAIFASPRRQRIGDLVAGTIVVRLGR